MSLRTFLWGCMLTSGFVGLLCLYRGEFDVITSALLADAGVNALLLYYLPRWYDWSDLTW